MKLDLQGATITEPFDISSAHTTSIDCERRGFLHIFDHNKRAGLPSYGIA